MYNFIEEWTKMKAKMKAKMKVKIIMKLTTIKPVIHI